MTIASETSKVAYSGNGSTARFAVPFHFARQEDVKVLLRRADGQEESLTLTTDYVLESAAEGGTCTMVTPPPEGSTLVLWRDPAILQETVYVEGVPLSAKARENALDLLTMICQANRERVDRAVKFSVASQAGEVVLPDPDAGKALVWNGAGTNLENGPDTSAIATANASAVSAGEARDAALIAQSASEAAATAAIAAKDQAEALAGSDASAIVFDPSGSGLSATDVDGALRELDAGKSDTGHTHSLTLADISDAGTAAGLDTGTSEGDVPVLGAGGLLDPAVLPSSGVPVGTVLWFAADSPPTGCLEADGSAISRTAYADLFGVIGEVHGNGDGSTTFNLPDLRGEFPRGWDHGRGVDSGRVFGSAQADEFKSHTHGYTHANATQSFALAGVNGYKSSSWTTTDATGGAETRPRNVALLPIIKY